MTCQNLKKYNQTPGSLVTWKSCREQLEARLSLSVPDQVDAGPENPEFEINSTAEIRK